MATALGSLVLVIEGLTPDQVEQLQGSIRLNPDAGYPFKVQTWDGRQEYLARPMSRGETVKLAGSILGTLCDTR